MAENICLAGFIAEKQCEGYQKKKKKLQLFIDDFTLKFHLLNFRVNYKEAICRWCFQNIEMLLAESAQPNTATVTQPIV